MIYYSNIPLDDELPFSTDLYSVCIVVRENSKEELIKHLKKVVQHFENIDYNE